MHNMRTRMCVCVLGARKPDGGVEVSVVQEAEALLARMSPAEKAQLLQAVVRDIGGAFAGIESHPDVYGGDPCIVRTRIPVWLLEQYRRLGVSESDLLANYPSLRAEDLVNAWAYVRIHRDEIDRQIEEQEAVEDVSPADLKVEAAR
jgi:uncharacterized protein (DUF433 family)